MTTIYGRFLVKLGVLVLLLVLMDLAVGTALRTFYFKQKSGLQYRTTYSIEQTKADVLFFGSSRCNHHYNPVIFEDSLKLTGYNVGRDGNRLPYHYAVLKGILNRYTPKMVVLDLSVDDLEENDEAYERLSSLLPYYQTHPEMRPVIAMRGPFEPVKLVSSIYPYNSSLLTIAIGNSPFNRKKQEDIKGFLPLLNIWDKSSKVERMALKTRKLDEQKVTLYKSFITDCQQRGIKLYVSVSPYYVSFERTPTLVMAEKIARQYQVPFLDYSQQTTFLQPHYFSDPAHLNVAGATAYSKTVVGLIRRDLLDPGQYTKKPTAPEKTNRQAKTVSPGKKERGTV